MTSPIEVTTVINNFRNYDTYAEFLAKAGHGHGLPFVEFLWDNYAHLNPAFVRDSLAPLGKRVAFHVMWSRFIDLEIPELTKYLDLLRTHVREMNPLYVSEHCCTFRAGNINLLEATELEWQSQLDNICERVDRYQDALGTQLLLENFGSIHDGGKHQVDHLAAITQRTGCGILFDVSNAVLADLNGVTSFASWLPLLENQAQIRTHVGGYSRDERLDVYEDSHAFALSDATHSALIRTIRELDIASVCYERAFNLDTDEMSQDFKDVERTVLKAAQSGGLHAEKK